MQKKIDTTSIKPKPYTSATLLARHGNSENKIDGINNSRGEGLPYSETPAKVGPYTSATLLARHGNFGTLNKIDGINSLRGEGLPYTESDSKIEEADIGTNIEEIKFK